jgi:hypothetical protein
MAQHDNSSLNYFENLRDTLGNQVRNVYKSYARVNTKLSRVITRKEYLIKCRKCFITPQHIKRSMKQTYTMISEPSPYRTAIENAALTYERSLLNIEIKIAFWKIGELKKELEYLYSEIITVSPLDIFEGFFNAQQRVFEKNLHTNRNRVEEKLKKQRKESLKVQEKWIINLTKHDFPPEMKKLLALGPKFSLPGPITKKDVFELIADTEQIIDEVDFGSKEDVRGKIVNVIMNETKRQGKTKSVVKAELEHMSTVTNSFLEANAEVMKKICFLQADKGNSTVILSREKYNDGMIALISDTNTYEQINRDPTLKIEKEFNAEIRKLCENGIISEQKRRQLTRYDSVCPRIYGLPKVHKLPNPIPENHEIKLRPIVSCQSSPVYNLSRFLCEILNNSIDQEKYNIKNSFAFRDFILAQTLPDGYVLISLDVVSLFTCIPWERVENAVNDNWEKIKKCTKLSQEEFTRLLKLMFDRSYFQYNKKFYKQIDGTAMGSPASPAIADIVMTTLLEKVVKDLREEIMFVRKYVDDLILAVKEEKVENVLNVFNAYHPAIQFTIEREVEQKIPFLDLLLIRKENGKIQTEFYVKPLASGRILNYNSNHPMHMKLNVAENLVRRMFELTSSEIKPISKARDMLSKNGYPMTIINKIIHRKKLSRRRDEGEQESKFKSMLYVEGLSEKIKKLVKQDAKHITLAFKARNPVKTFFTNMKDPIEPAQRSKLIYGIKCNNCYRREYVGMTTQKLANRISGHRSSLKCARKFFEGKQINHENVKASAKGSALVYHAIMKNHEFNLDDPQILHTTNNARKLNILEMLHIQDRKTVNLRTDCENLNIVYKSLLERCKNNNQLEF